VQATILCHFEAAERRTKFSRELSDRAAVTDANGHTTTFGYDSHGNRTTVTNALDQSTTYTYSVFGQGLV